MNNPQRGVSGGTDYRLFATPRVHGKEEESPGPLPDHLSPRGDHQHVIFHSGTIPGETGQDPGLGHKDSVHHVLQCSAPCQIAGNADILPGSVCMGMLQGERSSTSPSATSGQCILPPEQEHQAGCSSPGGYPLVAAPKQAFPRGTHPDIEQDPDLYRFQPARLGGRTQRAAWLRASGHPGGQPGA